MDNSSTEISLTAYSTLETKVTDHQKVVLLTKESLEAEKPISVGNNPPLKFAGGPTNSGNNRQLVGSMGHRYISSS